MLGFSNDTTNIQDSIEEEDSLGHIHFNETGYMPRIQILDSRRKPIKYNNETKKFIIVTA